MRNLPPLEEGVPIAGVWGREQMGIKAHFFSFTKAL